MLTDAWPPLRPSVTLPSIAWPDSGTFCRNRDDVPLEGDADQALQAAHEQVSSHDAWMGIDLVAALVAKDRMSREHSGRGRSDIHENQFARVGGDQQAISIGIGNQRYVFIEARISQRPGTCNCSLTSAWQIAPSLVQ